MDDWGIIKQFSKAILSGWLVHQLIFKRFEVDRHPLLLLAAFSLPTALRFLPPEILSQDEYTHNVPHLVVIVFISSLVANILVYRVFFHPLQSFPGPFRAELSKFWALTQAAKTGLKWYQVNNSLHQQYGDYVRTGPRELSISDPVAIALIMGFSSKTSKGPFYDSMETSVSTTRDKVFHRQRRKIWDSSLKQLLVPYATQIEVFTDDFVSRIRQSNFRKPGTLHPIHINELALHYSYDVMTQLAFGESGGFLAEKASEMSISALGGIQRGINAIGLLNQVPWVMSLLTCFAFLPGPMKVFNNWSNQALMERKERGMKQPDLMEYLITNTKPDRKGNSLLFSESRVIIGAGSDTTATALTEILILLAKYPQYPAQIRAEIKSTAFFSSQTSYPILDSVINETLRLYPPVLFASQRVTPPEGLQINDNLIPGNTVVSMPQYVLHRDPRNFVNPESFIPERWTSKQEMVLNRSAWMPFSAGPSNCPGKGLAMMELRSVVARVVSEFDVEFVDRVAFDEVKFFKDVKDHFVAGCPKIELCFRERKR